MLSIQTSTEGPTESRGATGNQTPRHHFLHPDIVSRVVCHVSQLRIHSIVECGKKPPGCLSVSSGESIRIWAGWQSTTGENTRLEKTGVRGLFASRQRLRLRQDPPRLRGLALHPRDSLRPAVAPGPPLLARETPDSERSGWPGGDIVKMKCPVCNKTWKQELPQ